jgi:hypothetical protein
MKLYFRAKLPPVPFSVCQLNAISFVYDSEQSFLAVVFEREWREHQIWVLNKKKWMLAVERLEETSLAIWSYFGQTQAESISCGCWCHFSLGEGIQLTQLLTNTLWLFLSCLEKIADDVLKSDQALDELLGTTTQAWTSNIKTWNLNWL